MKTTPELMADSYAYAEAPFASLVRFEDTVAVVTGGAAGIGRGIASRLAELGAEVVLLDLDPTVGDTATALADRHGAKVEGRVVDVRRSGDLDTVAREIAARTPRKVVWVNAAGVYPSHLLADLGDEEWEHVVGSTSPGVSTAPGPRRWPPARRAARRSSSTSARWPGSAPADRRG
jgi:hypothetical protein